MGHGNFGDHQAQQRNDLCCPCGSPGDSSPINMIQHFKYMYPQWRITLEYHFSRDYQIWKCKDLCLDPYYRKGVVAIVNNLLDWTLSNKKMGGVRRIGAAWSLPNSVIPCDSNVCHVRPKGLGIWTQCFEHNTGLPLGDRSKANSGSAWHPYTSTCSVHRQRCIGPAPQAHSP